jgi:hypothetical protein
MQSEYVRELGLTIVYCFTSSCCRSGVSTTVAEDNHLWRRVMFATRSFFFRLVVATTRRKLHSFSLTHDSLLCDLHFHSRISHVPFLASVFLAGRLCHTAIHMFYQSWYNWLSLVHLCSRRWSKYLCECTTTLVVCVAWSYHSLDIVNTPVYFYFYKETSSQIGIC